METEPLLEPSRSHDSSEASAPTHTPVYYFLALLFVGTFGQAMTLQANTDAEYLIICKYAGIPQETCFSDPGASNLEGILSSYVDVVGGIVSLVSLLLISHAVALVGMRPVVIAAIACGALQALSYWFLLAGPAVHYLWCIVPELLSNFTFYAMSQFLASIYISEKIVDAKYRTIFLGWMSAVISAPNILGPAVGAAALKLVSVGDLYLVCAGLNVFSAFLTLYLEESHSTPEQKPGILDAVRLMSCKYIVDPARRTTARKVIVFTVATSVVGNVLGFLQSIYVKTRFSWSATENGYLSSIGEAISLVSVAVIAPVVIARLSERFPRHNYDFDVVDAVLSQFLILCSLVPTVLKALFPRAGVYFVLQCLYQFRSVAQATLINNTFKYAPQGGISGFWVGVTYLVQFSMIPSVLAALNVYRKVLGVYPESLFWAATVGWVLLLGLVVTVRPRREREGDSPSAEP